jgi:endonuclease YncB( thermonuclease family)
VTVGVLASLFFGSSNAPGWTPVISHVSAGADQLAVLDGDTLRVGTHVVRLEGIVAPSRGSVCHGGGQLELDCGSAAANALADLVRGNSVDCAIHGHDGQGRPMAECSAAGRTLNSALVQNGWARTETAAPMVPERTARAAGLGIWRGGS